MYKTIVSLFILLFCISCNTNESIVSDDSHSKRGVVSRGVFWDRGSIKEHLYYHDYMFKGWKYFRHRIKRNPLPTDIQAEFIENLHNMVVSSQKNDGNLKRNPNEFFSNESIYEYVTTFEDWGIGESRRRCPKCLHNTIIIYYISPRSTWQALAGRAGYLCICPHCLTQCEFHCTALS